MAGQFAHISLVDTVCTPEGLDSVADLIPSVRSALENNRPFCRLGAVSPDCPSVVGATDATGWSGVMHYVRPAEFIRYAIPRILQMSFKTVEARACLAWIFGYTAHLVADYTIHPIVAELVGPTRTRRIAQLIVVVNWIRMPTSSSSSQAKRFSTLIFWILPAWLNAVCAETPTS